MNAKQVDIILSKAKKPSVLDVVTGTMTTTIRDFKTYEVSQLDKLLSLSLENGRILFIDTQQITMLNVEIDPNL